MVLGRESQRGVPGTATLTSPGNLLEMHVLRPQLRSTKSNALWVGASDLLNKFASVPLA